MTIERFIDRAIGYFIEDALMSDEASMTCVSVLAAKHVTANKEKFLKCFGLSAPLTRENRPSQTRKMVKAAEDEVRTCMQCPVIFCTLMMDYTRTEEETRIHIDVRSKRERYKIEYIWVWGRLKVDTNGELVHRGATISRLTDYNGFSENPPF